MDDDQAGKSRHERRRAAVLARRNGAQNSQSKGELILLPSQYGKYHADELKPSSQTLSVDQIIAGLHAKGNVALLKKTGGPTTKLLKASIEQFDFSELYIDQAYQRLANEAHIYNIATHFNPNACSPPIVCRRKYGDRRNVVVDGQQRAIAARLAEYTQITCQVVEVCDLMQEAQLFQHLNMFRKQIPTPVSHRNDLLLGQNASLRLEAACRAAGVVVGEGSGNCRVQGITRLHATAKTYGEPGKPNYDIVSHALRAYVTIWPDHKVIHLYLLSGLAMLIYVYGTAPHNPMIAQDFKVTPAALKEAIGLSEPSNQELLKKVRASRPAEQHRVASDYYYANILITAYNKHRKGKRRLNTSELVYYQTWSQDQTKE